MKNFEQNRKESDRNQKSIHNVLSLKEMMTIRGGGKVGEEDDGGFKP